MPSSNKARLAILQLIGEIDIGARKEAMAESRKEPRKEAKKELKKESKAIYELGSGWGNLLIPLARQYPQRNIVGYELSILPWIISVILKNMFGLTNLQIHRKNFMQAELNQASIIVCYLYPGAMEAIDHKLKLQTSGLEYLVSNTFALPSQQPVKMVKLNDLYRSPVYLYKIS